MKKTFGPALVAVLFLALAVPAEAGRGHGGGGSRGGQGGVHGGGVHGGGFHGGGVHHRGFHHGGFRRFGCCFGPAFVGGVFLGYPYYADSSPYPAYYSDPVYASVPTYQPQTQLTVAPSLQRQVCYVGGCYRLQ